MILKPMETLLEKPNSVMLMFNLPSKKKKNKTMQCKVCSICFSLKVTMIYRDRGFTFQGNLKIIFP